MVNFTLRLLLQMFLMLALSMSNIFRSAISELNLHLIVNDVNVNV